MTTWLLLWFSLLLLIFWAFCCNIVVFLLWLWPPPTPALLLRRPLRPEAVSIIPSEGLRLCSMRCCCCIWLKTLTSWWSWWPPWWCESRLPRPVAPSGGWGCNCPVVLADELWCWWTLCWGCCCWVALFELRFVRGRPRDCRRPEPELAVAWWLLSFDELLLRGADLITDGTASSRSGEELWRRRPRLCVHSLYVVILGPRLWCVET